MGNLEAGRVLRRAFNRLAGRRDKCTQEVAHLTMSDQYVCCSHKFITINLKSIIRKVNINSEGQENALAKNITDLYAVRNAHNNWRDQALYTKISHTLPTLSFAKFVEKYIAGKDSKIAKRTGDATKTIPIFSPEYKSTTTLNTYYKYCWVSLIKFKPWEGFIESLFGNGDDKDSCINMDNIEVPIQLRIIQSWELFLTLNNDNDILMRQIDRLNEPNERIEEDENNVN